MVGPVVEFLSPLLFDDGSMLQFWVRGGNRFLGNAACKFFGAYFDDHRLFKIKRVVGGVCVFGYLWNRGDAFDLHGSADWVGNALLYCAKVDPNMLHDVRASAFVMVIRFVGRGL
jgi:hypothetical protein